MTLNLVLALFWLVLALASLLYFLVQPAGGRVALFGNDIPVTWVAGIGVFMFCYNMLRWWLVRVQKQQGAGLEREAMKAISRRRPREHNPDFDFSDEERSEEK